MGFRLRNLFGAGRKPIMPASRARLSMTTLPAAIYAVGDVHGCLDQLQRLHAKILDDALSIPGDKLIVMLGDYIDRGPDSARVLDFLQQPLPEGFQRVCLVGNHEIVMLDHLADPGNAIRWLDFGGVETLQSYGVDFERYAAASGEERAAILASHIPLQHIEFARNLTALLAMPGLVFVHAGIRPGVPLAIQDERDLFWIRGAFTDSTLDLGALVVHGHTPGAAPIVRSNRICVDTGAYATGTLTAVRILPGQSPLFLNVTIQNNNS